MFEAARRMKTGVSNVKDLDMSLVKRRDTLKLEAGSCDVVLIDLASGEVNSNTKQVNASCQRFDFNSPQNFSTETDTTVVGRQAWDWILNPIGVDFFNTQIRDKKIMMIQNRKGFTYQQDDPQDDLFSFEIFKQFLLAPEAQDLKYGQDLNA
jgi:hypothetical protein